MKKHLLLIVLNILFFLTLSSCAFISPTKQAKQIVTTLYPEYDMVKKILGDNPETQGLFDVTMVIKPGQDSHTYDPSIEDLIIIKNADIFIYTADEMETWVNSLEFNDKTKVINLSSCEDIKLLKIEDSDEEEDEPSHEHVHAHAYDPHYWLYPLYAVEMVEMIKDTIISSIDDPYQDKTQVINNNAQKYIDTLLDIDADLNLISQKARNRTMYFGSPFAFYYLCYYYHLEYELIYQTCSTETEPSIDILTNIIKKMKQNHIKYIFSRELINTEACEMISYHTKATILELHSGHNVSAFDFNNPDCSFIKIMQQNVINIAKMLEVDQDIIDYLERKVQ